MKNFCLDLKDHAIKIMNNEEKKEMIPLNKEEKKYNVGKKNTIYAKKDLALTMTIKSITKSETILTTQENIEELLIIFLI